GAIDRWPVGSVELECGDAKGFEGGILSAREIKHRDGSAGFRKGAGVLAAETALAASDHGHVPIEAEQVGGSRRRQNVVSRRFLAARQATAPSLTSQSAKRPEASDGTRTSGLMARPNRAGR